MLNSRAIPVVETSSIPNLFGVLMLILLVFVSTTLKSDPKQAGSLDSTLENQAAADFTHIKWTNNGSSSEEVLFLPIINRSGIPLNREQNNEQGFDHSKIPFSIDSFFDGMINASQYFASAGQQSDYQLELTIDRYQHPFDYSPNENWWQGMGGKLNRLFSSSQNAQIVLSLRMKSNKRYIPAWQRVISVYLSECELNKAPQSLAFPLEQNDELDRYAHSSMGQAFIAAGNFLILQAIHHVRTNAVMARIDKVNQNDLLLVADNNSFNIGEKLALYHNNSYSNQTRLPVGSVQVIKTFENQALAYPVDLSISSIKVGDWVKVNKTGAYPRPSSIFLPVTQCDIKPIDDIVDNS